VSGSWQAERGSRRTRRNPRDDPRAEVGEDVRVGVGVGVGPMEFRLYWTLVVFAGNNSHTRHHVTPRHAPGTFCSLHYRCVVHP